MSKLFITASFIWYLLQANTIFAFDHADTLRGSNGTGRHWWDVTHYSLSVKFDVVEQTISGSNVIAFNVLEHPIDSLQLDLQQPLEVEQITFQYNDGGVIQSANDISWVREGNVYWVKYPFHNLAIGSQGKLNIKYKGKPRRAVNPPWDGGFSWKLDQAGKPWVSVSCQGLGASVWWPCKDAQWDEPDSGMDIRLSVPEDLIAVSNGVAIAEPVTGKDKKTEGIASYSWRVNNPINNYDVTFYIGDYIHWQDTIIGEKGALKLDYWVLKQNEAKARKQFQVVKPMLHCFEYWMGPYPFYEDGYKLVEAPYLGMEHQSAVAYGNDYKMGYKGYDRTGTGVGMNFDYIIVHESGHEWFGNNVTAKDMADNWVHEGITTYSETLFAECLLGKDKADEYCRGEWSNIRNDKPMIGTYGVNEEGSGDIYDKGTAIMHMIRAMTHDDEKFRQMLRGLGSKFYHKTVTTAEVEAFIEAGTGLDLKAFFNQYLRTANLPVFEYYIKKEELHYRFSGDIKQGFTLPLVAVAGKHKVQLDPTAEWKVIKWKGGYDLGLSKDYLFKHASE